ncbi:hypothetical protein MD484_g1484, partial [Candolleomyces efflorescens]
MSAYESSSSVVNEVKLSSLDQSKIVNISLYSNRAEVSRAYTKFKVAPGQNQLVLSSLPNLLDRSSLRVEGRGAVSIQDVTVSREISPIPPKTSPRLKELQEQKEDLENALRRCKKTQGVLESYIGTLKFDKQAASENKVNILPVIDSYDEAAEEYDKKETELKRKVKALEVEMDEERALLSASVPYVDPHRSMMATISMFAEAEGDAELTGILTVVIAMLGKASWTALYDIRVNTETKEQPVELIFRAAIQQSTGEDWTNAPVTLETATLTLDQSVPELKTWNLSIYKPAPPQLSSRNTSKSFLGYGEKKKKRKASQPSWTQSESLSADRSIALGLCSESDDDEDEGASPLEPATHATAAVTSKGSVNATFRVPGLITVPSDGVAHNVTVATLTPEAKLTWLSVPSIDHRVHLTAVLKNTSEYTLPEGSSGITVDGSFISKSTVPLVSPQESFTCALGLDPSIRVTYDPRAKKASQSGIISKTSSTVFTQLISVHNTKPIAVENLKIVDRIPVSEDSQIAVKLTSPALPTSTSAGTSLGLGSSTGALTKRVKLGDDVVAQWYGADEESTSTEYLGKDGKVQWLCSLPSQKKVTLTLQWEVSVPKEAVVVGL